MAITFGSVGTVQAGGTTTTAAPGVPAGTAANSVVFVCLNLASSLRTITAVPSGFTLCSPTPTTANDGSSNQVQYVYWKRCTGTDSGTYSFTIDAAPAWRTALAIRYEGLITTGTPFEAPTSGGSSTATASFPSLSLTTLGANRKLLWIANAFNGLAITQPSGFTSRYSLPTDNSDAAISIGDKDQAAAGATGTLTASMTGDTAPKNDWLAALIPQPASTAPGQFFAIL